MTDIIDNQYFIEGEIQLMLPITDHCTFIGANGIKLHIQYGNIFINDYIRHPKRHLFPYSDIPTHEGDYGTLANQLFQLDQTYLEIYTAGGLHQYRTDTFYQINGTVYHDSEIKENDLMETKEIKMTKEEVQERFLNILKSSQFLCIVDEEGTLHEYHKNSLDFDIPYSGVFVFGDGKELTASEYRMREHGTQVIVKSSSIPLSSSIARDVENAKYVEEPTIHGK